MDIDNKTVSQGAYRLHLIFVEYITAAQLATITSTPWEYFALLIYSCSMIVSKSQFCDSVAFQFG